MFVLGEVYNFFNSFIYTVNFGAVKTNLIWPVRFFVKRAISIVRSNNFRSSPKARVALRLLEQLVVSAGVKNTHIFFAGEEPAVGDGESIVASLAVHDDRVIFVVCFHHPVVCSSLADVWAKVIEINIELK